MDTSYEYENSQDFIRRYVRGTVDRTMPPPQSLYAKEMNDNLVAFDGEKEHWYELQGDSLVEWDVITNRTSNQKSLYGVLKKTFADFREVHKLNDAESNFLKSVIFRGIGPLPKELDKFRGIGLTFGPSRPSYYFSLFKRFDWYDNGVPTIVFCDAYAGIDELPRDVASDMSFTNATGGTTIVQGVGRNVITAAREKLDGELVCFIELVSPNMGCVSNYCLRNTINFSELPGYGYTEFYKGEHYHVAGNVKSIIRPFQNFDSFVDVHEGLVLIVSGVTYKLRKVNTFEIKISDKGMGYDAKGVFVNSLMNPYSLPLVAGTIYECCAGQTKSHVLLKKRILREGAHTNSQINSIINSPVLSNYTKFLVGAPIFVAPNPMFVSGKTLYDLKTAEGKILLKPTQKSLTLGKFVEVVVALTTKGSTTVNLILYELQKYSVVMTIEKILRLLAFAGCSHRSNFVRRHENYNLMRYSQQAIVRSSDEIVIAKSHRGEIPIIRSLLVYDTYLARNRPRTVAFALKATSLVFFTRPPNYGKYDFSAGGMVAWGENDDQAIIREISEELNEVTRIFTSDGETKKKMMTLRGKDYPIQEKEYNGIEMWSYFHFYEIDIVDEDNFDPGEGRIGIWRKPENVPMRHDYELVLKYYYGYGVHDDNIRW